MHCIFFSLCAGDEFLSNFSKKKSDLRKLLDFWFGAIMFSNAALVCLIFWTLYGIDRDLIHPVLCDTFFPPWLNHAVHTLPVFVVLIELLTVHRKFPSFRRGLTANICFTCAYSTWSVLVRLESGRWVYEVLDQLSPLHRFSFIGTMAVVKAMFYAGGQALQCLRWGGREAHKQKLP